MVSLIQFLIEGVSVFESSKYGSKLWDFYFRGQGHTETKLKTDSQLWEPDGTTATSITLPAGTPITVNGEDGEYNSKTLIIYQGKYYRVSQSNISKPIAAARRFGYLKPDKLGLAGRDIVMSAYPGELRAAIDRFAAPKEVKEYLSALVAWAEHPADEEAVSAAFARSGIRGNTFEVGTVNNDFLEALGPLLIPEGRPDSVVFFPTRGNEPIYDFIVDDVKYSSKRLSGHVNTLKVDHVLAIVEKEPFTLEKINQSPPNKLGLEVMKIIRSNTVKAGAKAIHDWLEKKGQKDTTIKPSSPFTTMMKSVTERLNYMIDKGQISCDIAINSAITNIVFCKAEIVIGSPGDNKMTDGTVRVEGDFARSPKTAVKTGFRFKGRDNEKLGFDIA